MCDGLGKNERNIGWLLVGCTIGVCLGLGINTARADDTKKLCLTNDAGGFVVITNKPCDVKLDAPTTLKLYEAYATEGDKKHMGCWTGGEGVISIFYEEFEKGVVANYNPEKFAECKGNLIE